MRPVQIEDVQRWVASAVLLVVGMPSAAVLAIVAPSMDADAATGARGGLWVMSAVVGVITVAGVLVIHKRSVLSPWLLAGLVPAAIGAFYAF